MKVLTTSLAPQVLTIIPRKYATSVSLSLVDDSTDTSVSYTITPTNGEDYMTLTQAFALVEGRFYDMTVTEIGTNDVIYKDKVFCTDQTIDQTQNEYYSVNENEYIQNNTSDNEYIIIE